MKLVLIKHLKCSRLVGGSIDVSYIDAGSVEERLQVDYKWMNGRVKVASIYICAYPDRNSKTKAFL